MKKRDGLFGPKEYLSNFEGSSCDMCRLVVDSVTVVIQPQDCFDKTIFGFSLLFLVRLIDF